MATTQINLRLPDELLAAVEAARGDIARNLWIRRAIEMRLELRDAEASIRAAVEQREHSYRQSAGPDVTNVRSSAQATRNVKPIPKGSKR